MCEIPHFTKKRFYVQLYCFLSISQISMTFSSLIKTCPKNWAAFVARVTAGVYMLPYGAKKMGLIGDGSFGATQSMLGDMGIPALVAALVIIAEFFGAISLIIGLLSRWSAFWLAIIIGYAGIFVHGSNGFFGADGYANQLLYVGLCVVVILLGSGAWSVDATLQENK